MNLLALAIAAVIVLPAVGLVAWAWSAMALVEVDWRTDDGFEARSLEP
jgi:hypothetical protein